MAVLEGLPLASGGGFNWVFLIEILITGILALFFLFYFNRLFATLISYGIRAYTWHTYRAYIDITALQISLLGGRIFFKRLTYHAHNITVYVYDGHITWRYWLRLVQEAEVFQDENSGKNGTPESRNTSPGKKADNEGDRKQSRQRSVDREEKGGVKTKKELPCRISVKVSGVEAFIYNRSPLYDGIVEAAARKAEESCNGSQSRGGFWDSPPDSSGGSDGIDGKSSGIPPQREDTNQTGTSTQPSEKPQIPFFLRCFPVKIECKRAAAAVGNENTTNVLTAKAEKSAGTIDAGRAGKLDLYQLLFNFTIEKINVAMKPNRDFKEFQLSAALRVLGKQELRTHPADEPTGVASHTAHESWRRIRSTFRPNRDAADSLRTASMRSVVGQSDAPRHHTDEHTPWHGLTRYLDEKQVNEHEEWQQIEYAKASELVECDKVTMLFYWDIPGPVPHAIDDNETLLSGSAHDGDMNGSKPPAYGLELGVHGGFVVYGPWADRQRINLQHIFFPASCVDATPSQPLKAGELRVCTVFQIDVIVEEDVVLRIPTREESKDHRWKGRAETAKPTDAHGKDTNEKHGRKSRRGWRRRGKQGPATVDARPYAWLDITVKKDSVVKYTMDMFPRPSGYRNTLDVDVKGLEMSSSVNHGLLWRSGPLVLDADISYPLSWNTLRKWPFNIVCNDLELFILRDHLFLIIDLVNDWASGAPPEFYTFVPFAYELNLTFKNFCMYLNVNDANIINEPADPERNDFLTLEGQLHAVLGIPMENFRPNRNQITFDVLGEDMQMRMLSPNRSTLSSFLHGKQVATLPKLTLLGSFSANQETRPGLTDVLRMDIVGSGLTLTAYGFFVRQLVNVKENYFGDYLHFKTLEEFQGASSDLEEANAKTASFPKPQTGNELDVILCIVAENATVLLPTTIYSAERFVRAELSRADLDLRVASYYLDMGLNLSPVSILSSKVTEEDGSPLETATNTQLYVSHVDLSGHRAFGHPPDEAAYLSQWDIDIGKITGELSSTFVHDLALAGRAFAFTISDAENALPVQAPVLIYEASFVQVRTGSARIWLHAGKDAFLLALEPVKVETNDWFSEAFSQRVTVLAPQITFACVDIRSASRHRTRAKRKEPVKTYAFLQTGITVDVVGRKRHFAEELQEQQSYIVLNDRRTGRAPFLRRRRVDAPISEQDDDDFDPPSMPYPSIPPPLKRAGSPTFRPGSLRSIRSLTDGKALRSKSSASSLSDSIRAGGLRVPDPHPWRSSRASESASSRSYHSTRESSSSSSSPSPHVRQGGRLPSDSERAKFGMPSSSMAFSSSYSEPYFPLETIEPDETNVPDFPQVTEADENDSDSSAIPEAMDNPDIDNEAEHVTIFLKVVPGIRAYVEPQVAIAASKVLESVLPKHPEEVMDAYHMGVMGVVQSQQAERHGHANFTEINMKLPSAHLRIVNSNDEDKIADRVDLRLQSLQSLVRIRNQPAESGPTMFLSLHTVLDKIELSLHQWQDLDATRPAIQMHVDDILVWLALTSTDAFHVSFRETDLVVSGPQAEYLALLALRLLPLIETLKTTFETIMQDNVRRLQLLAYTLTQHGENTGDPVFLTRMVYILRAFPDHCRNQDSWKILARFRHIMQQLPAETLEQLKAQSKAAKLCCPRDAATKVVESWTQWRNWDVPYVNQTTAFRMLFRPEGMQNAVQEREARATTLTFRSDMLRLAIEYEGHTSDVVLEETSIGVETIPPTTPQGLMLLEENKRTKTSLQVHTNAIAFSLDWTLFSIAEIVVPLIDQFKVLSDPLKPHDPRSAHQALEDGLSRHDFHVVFSTETGTIALRSLNLRHMIQADGLKLSVIGTTQASTELGLCVSAMVNIDSAITELHGSASQIWRTQLTSPSLYIDQLYPAKGNDAASTMTLAIAYDMLRIAVTEQVPGILHIVNSVILDEVTKVMRLVDQAKRVPPASIPSSPTARVASSFQSGSTSRPPKLHLAVLAGKIDLEVSLLQELIYRLQGTAASVRVAPSLARDQTFGIDFDIGRLNHAFVNTSDNHRTENGLVDVPPINGHVGLQFADEKTSVSVATTIEKIEIDAGTLQSVLVVVNEPEVQHVITAIKSGIEDVNSHVENLRLSSSPTKAEQPSQRPRSQAEDSIKFDVRFALLGVRFSARTPQLVRQSTAEVEFGIGPVHATASNRAASANKNPLIPEVRVQIHDIGASLQIHQGKQSLPCGNATLGLILHFNTSTDEHAKVTRELKVRSDHPEVNVYPDTASTIVDVINHLQDKIKHLDLSKEVDYLRRIRDERRQTVISRISGRQAEADQNEVQFSAEDLLAITTTIELTNIQAAWIVDESFAALPRARVEDLVFSIRNIEFTTRGGDEARLIIHDMQLQLAKKAESERHRSLNSALLPEVGFTVGTWSKDKIRSLACKATGKPLDIQLESRFIMPVNAVQRSIEVAIDRFKTGTATWQSTPTSSGAPRAKLFDAKQLGSVLVEADFAGAQVYIQGSGPRGGSLSAVATASQQQHYPQHGRYGQFAADGALMHTTLTAPGIAFNLEYNSQKHRPTMNAEFRLDASSNMLAPNVVPLVLEITRSVKEVMQHQNREPSPSKQPAAQETKATQKFFEDESIIAANPTAIFGKTKVDLGFRIRKQEFALSCQPIARVDAKASLEDFYFAINTVESEEHGHFFAVSAVMRNLNAQVKHMYSREPTFSYEMESIVLSAMNNKHLSGTPGVSAILNLNPTRIFINGKQFQDLLLFREIWLPPEIRDAASAPSSSSSSAPPAARPEDFLVQRYQTVAAAAAFPWNATVSIAKLSVDVDLGQSIGKSSFVMTNLWASQQKTSNFEQNLCIGLDGMAINSTGRMSGFIELGRLGVRTSIKWPEDSAEVYIRKTPLIQASVGFQRLRAKAAFDYQAFAFSDIEGFDFLMYNVRQPSGRDRLVAVLDCEKAYVFCTATGPAQAVGLYQAFDRLIQDKQAAYVQSLKDIEKHVRRESTVVPTRFGPVSETPTEAKAEKKTAISLHTDVVVTMGAISFGVYPSTFFDSQMLKLEANNIQARFAAGLDQEGLIIGGLGMTLGQLQVALSSVRRVTAVPKALDVSVDEVITSAVNAKGGTILRVPKVVASMQTWQAPNSNQVDYIFKSLFAGKIDVGWNLSRINFIKGMWTTHSRALASRLGKSLPESAVKITAGTQGGEGEGDAKTDAEQQEKITAEISLPQSKYEYHALEPPIIETPQLRDMGEATPPLEWIGLHRDRLPNVTHQIIIVSLLEVCKEVEDAYEKILGSS